MELGALVCTAASPACGECPLADTCTWVAAGKPVDPAVVRRGQAWAGTDRQLRGAIMRALRAGHPSPPIPLRLLTAPTEQLTAGESALLADVDEPVRRAISAVRDLDAGGERTARLATDLVDDGLAVLEEARLRLP
jgi:A/G-specific adenine glycosylase